MDFITDTRNKTRSCYLAVLRIYYRRIELLEAKFQLGRSKFRKLSKNDNKFSKLNQ